MFNYKMIIFCKLEDCKMSILIKTRKALPLLQNTWLLLEHGILSLSQ